MGLWINRQGWGFYWKMFIAMFASVAVAMLAFFIKPTYNPRFGLGVGALFAAVASTYVTSSLVPDTGVMTLADIFLAGYVVINLTLPWAATL